MYMYYFLCHFIIAYLFGRTIWTSYFCDDLYQSSKVQRNDTFSSVSQRHKVAECPYFYANKKVLWDNLGTTIERVNFTFTEIMARKFEIQRF